MSILLTSNGFNNSAKRSEEIDDMFRKLAKGKKIVIITNATKEGSNLKNISDIVENFEKVGAFKVDLLEINKNNVIDIFNYNIIYCAGGDLRLLINDMIDCNFKEHLIEFLKTGTYIGESAGAMILCDNIKWIWDIKKGTKPKYDVYPNSFEGLNLVKEKIFPHWDRVTEEIKIKTKQYENENGIKITRLNDGEYILL